jgi:hypothetical protein
MTSRHRLPNRRALETFAIEHEGQRYKVSIGRELVCVDREQLGPVLEVFVNAQKVNSPADVLVSDGAILISLLLQHGCSIETINHAMKRNPDGSPSSPLGRAAALIAAAGEPSTKSQPGERQHEDH